jgi:hypothetical protein
MQKNYEIEKFKVENHINTKIGDEYTVTLPDGTKFQAIVTKVVPNRYTILTKVLDQPEY